MKTNIKNVVANKLIHMGMIILSNFERLNEDEKEFIEATKSSLRVMAALKNKELENLNIFRETYEKNLEHPEKISYDHFFNFQEVLISKLEELYFSFQMIYAPLGYEHLKNLHLKYIEYNLKIMKCNIEKYYYQLITRDESKVEELSLISSAFGEKVIELEKLMPCEFTRVTGLKPK